MLLALGGQAVLAQRQHGPALATNGSDQHIIKHPVKHWREAAASQQDESSSEVGTAGDVCPRLEVGGARCKGPRFHARQAKSMDDLASGLMDRLEDLCMEYDPDSATKEDFDYHLGQLQAIQFELAWGLNFLRRTAPLHS